MSGCWSLETTIAMLVLIYFTPDFAQRCSQSYGLYVTCNVGSFEVFIRYDNNWPAQMNVSFLIEVLTFTQNENSGFLFFMTKSTEALLFETNFVHNMLAETTVMG